MEVSLSKITSVHTDILPPYPLHHNILRPSRQGFISRWHWHQSVEKHFSFSCGKCPFPPFQTADHVLRRQGKATDMILSQESSMPACFLISGLSTAQNCHPGDVTGVGVLLPEVWAQAGLLVSCLPQLTRHTGALRAVKQLNLAAFPIPLWPCPTLHMSLLDVLPPSLLLSRPSEPVLEIPPHLFYFWPMSKTTCRKPKHLILRSFLNSPSPLLQEKINKISNLWVQQVKS